MKDIPLLDFRRAFSRRWAVGLWPRLFEFVFQPVFVAAVVCMAFLAKEKENTIPAFANAFFYFTGLYAFWVGLFGACQSLNGEVQNGEWSYWTLGLRRFIPAHVMSIFGVNLVCALWNVSLFLISVVVISSLCLGNTDFNPFVSCFLTQSSSGADPFWQCGYMLKPMLIAKLGNCGPILFASSLYAISLFSATVCGVCFGMSLSVLFPDPAVSLNASVAFVVLLGMISLLGLQGDAGRSGKAPPSLKQEFANRFESCHLVGLNDDTKDNDKKYVSVDISAFLPQLSFFKIGSTNRSTRVLVGISRFLPQRYFFNIARMPLEKGCSEDMYLSMRKELSARNEIDSCSGWWEKRQSLTNVGMNSSLNPWGFAASTNDPPPDATEFLRDQIKADGSFASRNRTDLFWRTFWKAVGLELIPLSCMCVLCLAFVNIGVLVFPPFRKLR